MPGSLAISFGAPDPAGSPLRVYSDAPSADRRGPMVRSRKPLQFEAHALLRMQGRGISEDQIERAVRSPDVSRPARREGCRRLEKRFSRRRRLAVIVEPTRGFIRVISAFWM